MNVRSMSRDKLGLLRGAARISVLAGVVGSAVLLLRAGQRTPRFLLAIMMLWVLAPFMAVVMADVISKRWREHTRAMLYGVMLLVAVGSLGMYAEDAWRPRKAQAGFVFVVTPLASWVLLAIVAPIAALKSRRMPGQ
jgi:hypothetical protein